MIFSRVKVESMLYEVLSIISQDADWARSTGNKMGFASLLTSVLTGLLGSRQSTATITAKVLPAFTLPMTAVPEVVIGSIWPLALVGAMSIWN